MNFLFFIPVKSFGSVYGVAVGLGIKTPPCGCLTLYWAANDAELDEP